VADVVREGGHRDTFLALSSRTTIATASSVTSAWWTLIASCTIATTLARIEARLERRPDHASDHRCNDRVDGLVVAVVVLEAGDAESRRD